MVLSGVMIRLGLTESFSSLLYPILKPILHISRNVCYAIIMGFLCGFPMGARVTADLLERGMITPREAEYLLSFTNNIGPVYFCSFVLPLLERRLIWPYLLGMYGIPFLYGIILRYTKFRDLDCCPKSSLRKRFSLGKKDMVLCSKDPSYSMLGQIDEAITSSIQSILMLGGYMILFNLFNLYPTVIFPALGLDRLCAAAAPVLEITGGLNSLGAAFPLFSLLLLPFGGLSCIAQTYSMIKETSLSITSYVGNKIVLTMLTALFYLGWFLFWPSCFLL